MDFSIYFTLEIYVSIFDFLKKYVTLEMHLSVFVTNQDKFFNIDIESSNQHFSFGIFLRLIHLKLLSFI